MLDIVASLSAMVLCIFLTASLWRQRRVGPIQTSLLGVMFTIVYIYSVAAHQDSVYRNHEAAAWAAGRLHGGGDTHRRRVQAQGSGLDLQAVDS